MMQRIRDQGWETCDHRPWYTHTYLILRFSLLGLMSVLTPQKRILFQTCRRSISTGHLPFLETGGTWWNKRKDHRWQREHRLSQIQIKRLLTLWTMYWKSYQLMTWKERVRLYVWRDFLMGISGRGEKRRNERKELLRLLMEGRRIISPVWNRYYIIARSKTLYAGVRHKEIKRKHRSRPRRKKGV